MGGSYVSRYVLRDCRRVRHHDMKVRPVERCWLLVAWLLVAEENALANAMVSASTANRRVEQLS